VGLGLADQLTVARIAAAPLVVVLYVWHFAGHDYWATGVFIAAMATDQVDGWLARRQGRPTALGSLLDPVADKIIVLSVMIVLIEQGVFRGWMVAAVVAREFLVSGLRLAAIERGVVVHARDLGKLKTWAQAVAAAVGGFSAAGAWSHSVAWWTLLVALALTWLSGLDYARAAQASSAAGLSPSTPASHQALARSRGSSSRRCSAETSASRSPGGNSGRSSSHTASA